MDLNPNKQRQLVFEVAKELLKHSKENLLLQFEKEYQMIDIERVKKFFLFNYICPKCGVVAQCFKIKIRRHKDGKPYGDPRYFNYKRIYDELVTRRSFMSLLEVSYKNKILICPNGHNSIELKVFDRISDKEVKTYYLIPA